MPELIVFLALIGLVIVVFFLFARNYKLQLMHRERMVALEKGVALPPFPVERPWSPRVYLLRGLIWSLVGAALVICLLGLATTSRRPATPSDIAFEAKRLSDYAGIPREEATRIVERSQRTEQVPPTVALLGLLPLAVGLAYLVFYYTGERHEPVSHPFPADTTQV